MAGQRVLVDTGPLVALMNKRNRHHQRFVEYLRFFQGQLVTTWPVLTEVTHHVPVAKAVEIKCCLNRQVDAALFKQRRSC